MSRRIGIVAFSFDGKPGFFINGYQEIDFFFFYTSKMIQDGRSDAN